MKTYKVAFCPDYGGSFFSEALKTRVLEIMNKDVEDIYQLPRHHPALIQAIEELGSEDSGDNDCVWEIEQISCQKYIIREYDGSECVVSENQIRWTDAEDLTTSTIR